MSKPNTVRNRHGQTGPIHTVAATRNGRRRAQSVATTKREQEANPPKAIPPDSAPGHSGPSQRIIPADRTRERTVEDTPVAPDRIAARATDTDGQPVGRQRSKSVAVTSNERRDNPFVQTLGERAQGGNTSGATKLQQPFREAFFKPNEETLTNRPPAVKIAGIPNQNPRLGERSLVTYKIGQALLDYQVPLPLTYIDTVEGGDGTPREGLVMQKAPGKSAADIDGKRAFDPKIIKPKFVENLLDLQAIDFITGQTDRNLTNIFVQEEGGILSGLSGIDSDTSFGKNALSGRSGKPDKFPHDIYLVSKTFKKNLEERYDSIVEIINAANLLPAEKEQALFRLHQLKKVAVSADTTSANDLESFIKFGPYFGNIAGHIFEGRDTLGGREKRDYTFATEKKAIEQTTQEFFTRYPDVFLEKHLQKLVQLNNDLKQLEGTENFEAEVLKIVGGINEAIQTITTKAEESGLPFNLPAIPGLNAHDLAERDNLDEVIKEINLDSTINLIQGQLLTLERKQIETQEEAERKAIFEQFHTIVLPRPSTSEPPLTPPAVSPTPFDLSPEGQKGEALTNRRMMSRLRKDLEYARQQEEQDSEHEDIQTNPLGMTTATPAVLATPVVPPTRPESSRLAPLKEVIGRSEAQKKKVVRLSEGPGRQGPLPPGNRSINTAPGGPGSVLSRRDEERIQRIANIGK